MKAMNHKFKEFVTKYPDGRNEYKIICDLGHGQDQDGSPGEGGGTCRRITKTWNEQQAHRNNLEVKKGK